MGRNHRKAQSAVFEQVLLFAIGVLIFIMFFAIFASYQDYFMSVGVNDQLESVRNMVALTVLHLSEKEYAVGSTVTLPISKKIGGEAYKVELSESGLNVTSLVSGMSKLSNLYGLNMSFELSGRALSTMGRIVIYKKENEIRLI